MKIGSKNFNEALTIIAKSNNVKLSINVPITDNYSNVHAIVIHKCNPSLVSELINAKFSISQGKKGMYISDFLRLDLNA